MYNAYHKELYCVPLSNLIVSISILSTFVLVHVFKLIMRIVDTYVYSPHYPYYLNEYHKMQLHYHFMILTLAYHLIPLSII